MTPQEITAETLYVKKGRRYVPWGTTVDRYNHDNENDQWFELSFNPIEKP